jgi:3-oxoadipate enol-lactonase
MIQTRAFASADGAMAGMRHLGDRGDALLFVHGVGSTAAIWDAQLHAFSRDHRCVAVELRGNGVPKPEPAAEVITREGYARDVLAAMNDANIERGTIVGCSLGGVVAFEIWKRAPTRIASMVIVGSFARYPSAQAYADSVRAAVLAAGSMEVFARERAAKLGLPPDRLRETLEQMACKDVGSYLAATQATWTGNYTDMLSSITVPVLVLCGERDVVAPYDLSVAIAAGIPDAQLQIVPNAGHVANADNPGDFNRMLRAFLDGR